MTMTLTIPEDIVRAAEVLSRASGSSPEELMLRALQAHFPTLPPPLLAEFDAWNLASDQDMARLEAEEGLG